jgi:hypothetical protein
MVDILGQPCLPWGLTGSDRLQYYVQWVPDLPPKASVPLDHRAARVSL